MTAAAVLWDVDGTFALTEELHFRSLLDASGRYGARLDDALQHELVGLSVRPVYDYLRERRGLRADFQRWADERYFYYREHAAEIEPRPGALEIWRGFAAQRIPQALVSNSDRLLVDINIEALGLNRPGLVSVTRNDVRRGKPDPEPYLRAAYLLEAAPGRCVAVEDTATGAAAALAAGMRVAFWPEQAGTACPRGCVPIEDVAELPAVVEDF